MNGALSVVDAVEMVDVAFALQGQTIVREHALALRQALCAVWPWLEHEAYAGIHPLRLVPGTEVLAPLSARARLTLRVPHHRVRDLAAAGSRRIVLMGHPLRLGPPEQRELKPHSAMYAYRVAAPGPDETAFMELVTREMARLGIAAAQVCGRHQQLELGDGRLDAFSLMLHEMTAADALRLQQLGLGGQRLLGCGVFVPHRSAAAV